MIFPLAVTASSSTVDSADLLDQFMQYLESKNLELYPAQEEAILALFAGDNVILNTPTGSGKSLVAAALHFYSLARGRRSIYTCPIKALVNEKFFDLCRLFGPDKVGMITGDATVNAKAPILCCTAEILANFALRDGKATELEDVIMDEFHYYSDRDRGTAWQIPLLTLDYSRFLLMSATFGDASRFCQILTDRTSKKTTLVSSKDRPVPLDFSYKETPLGETLSDLVKQNRAPIYLVHFTQRQAAEEAQNLLSLDYSSKEEKKAIAAEIQGFHFSSPYGRELSKMLRHGIGIHHAGLLPKYRLLVERLTQKGLLKVISGTDTLGMGVNVPIRSVVLSQLCKFDGQKTTILPVRDFQQICGRAGRRGFDDRGTVVVQAPAHVIDNKNAELKAASDPKKAKKLKKKQAPQKGYVHWDDKVFERLCQSEPESLKSVFQVSHSMLLQVLARSEDGCKAMRQLIRDCHETDSSKTKLRKQAFRFFRSLVARGIIEFSSPTDENTRKKKIRVNLDLQEDFSIFHSLSIWLLDTLALLDNSSPDFALDVLSLVEAIQENPKSILLRQVDKAKTEKIWQLKQEGVEYEERMTILEGVTYPKPRADFIYQSFNEFIGIHPWLSQENINPKSIARELYENYMSFDEYVKEYGLQRIEGTLLRYLSQVYKALLQSVPESYRTPELEDLMAYLRVIVKTVDASVLEEWEQMGRQPEDSASQASSEPNKSELDLRKDLKTLNILVRNESFKLLRLLSQGRYQHLIDQINSDRGEQKPRWTSEALAKTFEALQPERFTIHGRIGSPPFFKMAAEHNHWVVEQTPLDFDEPLDWTLHFRVSLNTQDQENLVEISHLEFRPASQ